MRVLVSNAASESVACNRALFVTSLAIGIVPERDSEVAVRAGTANIGIRIFAE